MTEAKFGQLGTFDASSDFAVQSFIIQQALGLVRTSIPAKVVAVHGGGVGAPPTVDAQPLINLINNQGDKTAHGVIFNIPVFRLQGGLNAVILDPVVGDIGELVVADRDISSLKANAGAISNPGSFRRFNLADAVFFGGILNPADPNQYVQFTSTGIKITDKNGNVIEMKAGQIAITGNVVVTGNISATGSITAGAGGADSVGLQSHIHGSSPPPNPGT